MTVTIGRRELLGALGGAAAAWPLAARAQQSRKLPSIGFSGTTSQSAWSTWTAAFVRRLNEMGWIEGRTVSTSVITTHALFAWKVQRKLSNGVAGLPPADHFPIERDRGQFVPSSATPHDGQRPCRTLAEDPGRTQPRAAYPRRCSSNASGLHGRNSARILGIRASFQRDNLRRHF